MSTEAIQTTLEFHSPLFQGVYPLRYHLLRTSYDMPMKVWHVNTVWEGYNSHGYPVGPLESNEGIYHEAVSISDIKKIIAIAKNDADRNHYIMARIDYTLIKGMKEFLE